MRVETWIKWEGEGIPDREWKEIEGIIAVKESEVIYETNSPEAVAIRGKLAGITPMLTNIKCKECGALMEKYLLHPHPKANRLGWKFRYICSNNDCLYEYYTKEDV